MDDIASSHQDEDIAVSADDLRQQLCVEIGKDAANHVPRSAERRIAEEYPAEDNEMEGQQGGSYPAQSFALIMTVAVQYLLTEELVNGKCKAVKTAPDDEVERGAVPQSSEEHGDHQVEVLTDATVTIATK